jgi:hypothetical protein
MAIYIVAVSLYPCSDMESSITSSHSIEKEVHHEGHSHTDHQDTCPPFCVCNCCGVQMLNYLSAVSFDFRKPFQSISSKESFYVSNWSDAYSGSIWQPPQRV